jgi:hypothetical protein
MNEIHIFTSEVLFIFHSRIQFLISFLTGQKIKQAQGKSSHVNSVCGLHVRLHLCQADATYYNDSISSSMPWRVPV